MIKKQFFILLVGALGMLASCQKRASATLSDDNIVASVLDYQLTRQEIAAVVPEGLNTADSAAWVESYIKRWVTDHLVADIASWGAETQSEIEQKVEQYRLQLIVDRFQQELVEKESFLGPEEQPAEESTQESVPVQQKAQEDLFKGYCVKVPVSNSKLTAKLRSVTKELNDQALNQIDALCKTDDNANYSFFTETWTSAAEVSKNIQATFILNGKRFLKSKTLEISDQGYIYLFYISEVAIKGEMYQPSKTYKRSREIQKNANSKEYQLEYIQKFRDEIYQKGLQEGKAAVREN